VPLDASKHQLLLPYELLLTMRAKVIFPVNPALVGQENYLITMASMWLAGNAKKLSTVKFIF
jgi:hypothetical protein